MLGDVDIGFLSKVATFLGVDRTNLYKQHRQASKDTELITQIKTVWLTDPAYGHRRLADKLGFSKKRIRRVMKLYGLVVPNRPKQFKKVNKATKPAPLNLLRDHKIKTENNNELTIKGLVASYPHHIWAEDFTYLWFNNRFYYLATVIDLYSRVIVGWSLGTRHVTELMVEALMDAIVHYIPALVLHNDRGSEYLSLKYSLLCDSLEITPSASAPGKPWENGFQESFYGKFKLELGDIKRFNSEGELLEAIALQLYYYNNKRLHTSIKSTPQAYLNTYQDLIKTNVPINRSITVVKDKV